MAEQKNPLGPIGSTAASNLKRLREARGLSFAELSRRLDELGRPIATLGLSRIESRSRRIDTDDLVALAISLDVSPLAILLPTDDSALTPKGTEYKAQRIWHWAQGSQLLDGGGVVEHAMYARDSNPIDFRIAEERQQAGEVNENPVAVPRVASKRVRERRNDAVGRAVEPADD
ncbi:helix-turn-helix transcriptional regulator [Rhodococcus sp. G-MC3]|uniref:helix-turn-helix domain-containing protein n=1 Tax=Rhodococcus sp. G-MC3 TaxID=3046209 RepID=UPI0024BA966C|nr:helix-turn-helix transcriptional regulator [Rhodococcus sp. G-MC3]MDJ0394257.1 helix-turn-helix transcriptional regulator [Rhodococcus sp. G-MC3]